MMLKGCSVHKIAWVLVIIGALNWGLVGLFDWNLVEAVLGNWDWAVTAVYILVGVSAILSLTCHSCKMCKKG
jgi:hypothetical protein